MALSGLRNIKSRVLRIVSNKGSTAACGLIASSRGCSTKAQASSSAPSIKEEAVDAGIESRPRDPVPPVVEPKPLPMMPVLPPRRRRVASSRMSQSNSSSVADTEYTMNEDSGPKIGSIVSISRTETVHIRSMADWISKNIQDGDTYGELLRSMVDSNMASSKLCIDVCNDVKTRMGSDPSYDAWTECKNADSATVKWIKSTIG
ncbi:hypothetical protein IWX90DRAFT_415381 [Phyllosticta citrichinensis]|uniref:Uncharacterized protein n=1 Tax=Phyllosticta citrichinensis TaxID=1130410 RepID=A0ABR1XV36_9PEZI